jgi:hypothetical protein
LLPEHADAAGAVDLEQVGTSKRTVESVAAQHRLRRQVDLLDLDAEEMSAMPVERGRHWITLEARGRQC